MHRQNLIHQVRTARPLFPNSHLMITTIVLQTVLKNLIKKEQKIMFLRYQVLAYISMYVLFFWLHHFNCKYLTFEKKFLYFFVPFKCNKYDHCVWETVNGSDLCVDCILQELLSFSLSNVILI